MPTEDRRGRTLAWIPQHILPDGRTVRRESCPLAKTGTFKLAYIGGRWAYQMRHGGKMEQKGPGFKQRLANA